MTRNSERFLLYPVREPFDFQQPRSSVVDLTQPNEADSTIQQAAGLQSRIPANGEQSDGFIQGFESNASSPLVLENERQVGHRLGEVRSLACDPEVGRAELQTLPCPPIVTTSVERHASDPIGLCSELARRTSGANHQRCEAKGHAGLPKSHQTMRIEELCDVVLIRRGNESLQSPVFNLGLLQVSGVDQ
jgi:hypothetical protein